MHSLQVFLFGGSVRVCNDSGEEIRLRPSGQALLAYLLLHRQRTHRRETLADLFWGDQNEKQARHCLSSTLCRLRSQLEAHAPAGAVYLLTSNDEIGFNQESHYWLDVAHFETNINRCLAQPPTTMTQADVCLLEETLQLCTGELLENLYDDWALRAREYFRSLHLKALAHLMHYYHHQGALEKSLSYGAQILQIDPLREQIHREVMRLYWESGYRDKAILQYELCRRALAAELKIEPMEETQSLYAQMTAVQPPPFLNHPARPRSADPLKQVVQELETAVNHLHTTRLHLNRVLENLSLLTTSPELTSQIQHLQTQLHGIHPS